MSPCNVGVIIPILKMRGTKCGESKPSSQLPEVVSGRTAIQDRVYLHLKLPCSPFIALGKAYALGRRDGE